MDKLKSVFVGLLLIAGGFWFWHSIVGNPINELALIKRGVTTKGVITDTWEDGADDDRGKTHFFHGIAYTFQLPDGQIATGYISNRQGRLHGSIPQPFEIEYLPDNPAVSRIKGDGSPTVTDWFWRTVVAGGALLALFLSPGVTIIYKEFYPKPEN